MENQFSESKQGDYKVAITFSTKKNCKLFIFRKGYLRSEGPMVTETFRCKTLDKAKVILKRYNISNIIMGVYIDKDFKQQFFNLNNQTNKNN